MKFFFFKTFIISLSLISTNLAVSFNNQLSSNNDSLAIDPSINHGYLTNGLKYYIRDTNDGSEKVEIRLYVKVGGFYQNQEELEFAHTLEHLAFKCAKDFPFNLLNAPTNFLSNLGINRRDIEGHTRFTSTWYSIKNIPSDSTHTFETGLRWFSNILDLNLSKNVIQKEKGVIRQELIFRNGRDLEGFFLNNRLLSMINPCYENTSNFFEHNSNYPAESLIKFYKKWYRPDRMGIIIVGDISDLNSVESQIKKQFSGLKRYQNSDKWPGCDKKYLDSPERFVVLNHNRNKIFQEHGVDLFFYQRNKDILKHRKDWSGLQSELIWDILYKVINRRFNQLNSSYKTSFSASYYPPQQFLPASHIKIETTKGQEQDDIVKAFQILKKLKIFGLTTEEWEQVKAEQLKYLKQSKTKSYYFEHISKHFLYGKALPANRSSHLIHWLSKLSLEEFNVLCKNLIPVRPDDIGIIAPAGKSYTKNEVQTFINNALKENIIPHPLPEVPTQLISERKLSTIHKVGYTDYGITPTGAIEFILDNGMRIVLDTTFTNNGNVSFHGFSTKGAAYFSKKDYFSAINAAEIVKNSGVGNFDKFAIDHFLNDTGIWQGTGPYIHYGETGIRGSGDIKSIEYILQLIYLYFTNPRKNREAFEDWQKNEIERHLNPAYSVISEDFNMLIRQFLGNHSEIPQGTKRLHGVNKTDMERAYTIYSELFGKALDFTFLFSGDFSLSDILPLLQKYLGNIPNNPLKSSFSSKPDITFSLPVGPIYKEFLVQDIEASYNLHSVRYSLRHIAKVEDVLHWKEQIKIKILGDYMNSTIKELRSTHELALYSMRAFTFFEKEPMIYEFRMSIDCIPEELDKIRKLCRKMVKDVKNGSFNQAQIEMILNKEYIKIPQSTNYNYYRFEDPYVREIDIKRYVESLNSKDIQQTAEKYLKNENLMEFVFRDSSTNP